MEDDLKILQVEYLSNHLLDIAQILNLSLDDQTTLYMVQILWIKTNFNGRWPPMEDDLQWKTTYNGRWPQNIESWISQQPLIESYSDFKLQLIWPTIFCKSFKWRRPPIEDDLKILKVEYLSNLLLDHTQISNLSLYDQTIFCQFFKWRQPPMEEDLKIFKVEYLSNH